MAPPKRGGYTEFKDKPVPPPSRSWAVGLTICVAVLFALAIPALIGAFVTLTELRTGFATGSIRTNVLNVTDSIDMSTATIVTAPAYIVVGSGTPGVEDWPGTFAARKRSHPASLPIYPSFLPVTQMPPAGAVFVPTIKDALKLIHGKTITNTSIFLRAGTYNENVVLDGFTSNCGSTQSNDPEDTTGPTKCRGLNFIGDTRIIAGYTYVTGAIQSPSSPPHPAAGADFAYVTVTCDSSTSISVTAPGNAGLGSFLPSTTVPDFGVLGIVPGDIIVIGDGVTRTTAQKTVTSVSGNVVSFSPSGCVASGIGSSLTFMPNRRIVAQGTVGNGTVDTIDEAYHIAAAGLNVLQTVNVVGLWVQEPVVPSTLVDVVCLVQGNKQYLSGVVCDRRNLNTVDSPAMIIQSTGFGAFGGPHRVQDSPLGLNVTGLPNVYSGQLYDYSGHVTTFGTAEVYHAQFETSSLTTIGGGIFLFQAGSLVAEQIVAVRKIDTNAACTLLSDSFMFSSSASCFASDGDGVQIRSGSALHTWAYGVLRVASTGVCVRVYDSSDLTVMDGFGNGAIQGGALPVNTFELIGCPTGFNLRDASRTFLNTNPVFSSGAGSTTRYSQADAASLVINQNVVIPARTITTNGTLNPDWRVQYLAGTGPRNITITSTQLATMLNKEYTVYSSTLQLHNITLSGGASWDDADSSFTTLLFEAVPGAYVTFRVVNSTLLTILHSDGVDVCSVDACEEPFKLRDRRARTFVVGPTRTYKTVSQALAQFNGRNVGKVTINMDAGIYADNIVLGGNHTSSSHYPRYNPDGLEVNGDLRPHVGYTVIDGAPNSAPAGTEWIVTTNIPGIGPYSGRGSGYDQDLAVPATQIFAVNDGVADVTNGCETSTPWTGVAGKIAIIQRGSCGFFIKTQNAASQGAVAVLLYQNSAADPSIPVGAPEGSLATTTVMISQANATQLLAALVNNTSMTITMNPAPTFYGARGGIVDIIHPGGNLTQLQVDTVGGNANFTGLGVVAGDTLVVSRPTNFIGQPLFFRVTVASVSNNVISLTAPLANASDIALSSITFIPNVIIRAASSYTAVLSVSVIGGAAFRGVSFEESSTETVANTLPTLVEIVGTDFQVSGCVFDTSRLASSNGLNVGVGAKLFSSFSPFVTVLRGQTNVEEAAMANLNVFSSISAAGSAINIIRNSLMAANTIQIANANCLGLFSPAVAVTTARLWVTDIFIGGTYPNVPALNMVVNSQATVVNNAIITGSSPVASSGVSADNGSNIIIENLSVATPCVTGLILSDDSRITIGNTIVNTCPTRYVVLDTSKLSTFDATRNTVVHSTASAVIDHAFEKQTFSRFGSVVSATLNPAAAFAGSPLYVGRRFKLINEDGAPHTITLNGLATFTAPGLGPLNNQFVFAPVNGTCVELYVTSPVSVQVCETSGGNFTTVPVIARRTEEEEEMPHDEKMYMMAKQMTKEPQTVGESI